jgi:hypothetical protein
MQERTPLSSARRPAAFYARRRSTPKATLLLLAGLLTGCTENLPYFVAIGDAGLTADPCVVPLHRVVADTLQDLKVKPMGAVPQTIKTVQVALEKKLAENVAKLDLGCTDGASRPIPGLDRMSSKWIETYSYQSANPDQDLSRFEEFLLSAQLVKTLATENLKADENKDDTQSLVEDQDDRRSQWCGRPPRPKWDPQPATIPTDCPKRRALYKVTTYPDNLYETLFQQARAITDRNRHLFVLGYEIPWDADKTLIRYGITFYFHDQPVSDGLPAQTLFLGYDLLYANEGTPEPYLANRVAPEKTTTVTPWTRSWWSVTGYPFSVIIGVKNAAFEMAKVPFSLIAGALVGRDGWNYPLQNIVTAGNALAVELFSETRGGAEHGLYRLFTDIPIVGQIFQYNSSADRSEPDELPPARKKIFLSRGIYGGNKWGQDTGLWAAAAKQDYPDYDIYSPPYRHGTVIDVVWSMFNLSHGPAYNEAQYVMDHAGYQDRIYLAGHSGGVQRSVSASRILWDHGYPVRKVVGIAGPSIGQAFVDPRYPDAFRVYLNTASGANQDIVSKVGVVAGTFTTVLDYATIVPLKYVVGGLCFTNNACRDTIYTYADRLGSTNATIIQVDRKPSSQHQTPLRQSLTDRLVFDAYVRGEFATAFREDLERPGEPELKKDEPPNAIPWKR